MSDYFYLYNTYIDKCLNDEMSWDEIELLCEPDEPSAEKRLEWFVITEDWDEDFTLDDWKAYVAKFRKNNPRPISIPATTITAPGHPVRTPPPPGGNSAWAALRSRLLNDEGISQKSVDSIEHSAREVSSRCSLDTSASGSIKGLVYGSVQSGKTANMEAIMSMAADDDFNIFIILTGTIDNLRIQTRDRFKGDLVSTPSVAWRHLDFAGEDKKFKASQLDLGAAGSFSSGSRYVITCLKQKSRLTKLIRWLYSDPSKTGRMRLIVIDDEADQASINTATILEGKDAEEYVQERKAINGLIVNLANGKLDDGKDPAARIQAINYLCFTATPYANVLNEKPGESLYPKDFVHALADPDEYFGCSVIFGDPSYRDENDELSCPGLDIVRPIASTEEKALKDIHEGKAWGMQPALEESLCWFLCAAASLRSRGWRKPISMLVHTSSKTNDHFADYHLVMDYLKGIGTDELLAKCEAVYDRETRRFGYEDLAKNFSRYGLLSEVKHEYPSFAEISDEIERIASDVSNIYFDGTERSYSEGVNLCVDNCKANKAEGPETILRAIYPSREQLKHMSKAPVFIVMGGNTLSRGLTIEGLVCTYFARNVTQADTLMQMGRWFGYRIGYETYQRLWMTPSAKNKYRALAKAEMSLKEEIRSFQAKGLSPSQLGIKVSTIPEIARFKLTADKKMQGAEACSFDFTGYSEEITEYSADENVIEANLLLTENMLAELTKASNPEIGKGSVIWRDVAHSTVMCYLDKYQASNCAPFGETKEQLLDWIEQSEQLDAWNIAVCGHGKTPQGTWTVPGGITLERICRTKHAQKTECIDIGSLRSGLDAICDVQVGKLNAGQKKLLAETKSKKKNIVANRAKLGLERRPLLLIYRMDRLAGGKSSKRIGIGTASDLVGFAIVVPGDKNAGGTSTMVHVNLQKGADRQ